MTVFSELEAICKGKNVMFTEDRPVVSLGTDSRKVIASAGAVFFALSGPRHDGHSYIAAVHAAGIRQFVIDRNVDLSGLTESNILHVPSVLDALQELVAWHRMQFTLPVVGITGSNAKTIVKEWLYQLLSADFSIVKNPGSYNSQTGVPLSVWQLRTYHQLGIFEAGISLPGEMARLQKIIQPTIGIFTNLGPAHAEGFESDRQKMQEKIQLFQNARVIIYCKDHTDAAREIEAARQPGQQLLSWGTSPDSALRIVRSSPGEYQLTWNEHTFRLQFPFTDAASSENGLHCAAALLHLGYAPEQLQERFYQLETIPMRLELKQGINHCQIIDDSYNNDLSGLQIGLEFLSGIQTKKGTVILSDILQSGLSAEVLTERIADLITGAQVRLLIGIGPLMKSWDGFFAGRFPFEGFSTTEEFLEKFDPERFQQDVILVKGARSFGFERIVRLLQRKIHGTVMEVDLGAMVHNLNFFRAGLRPGVRLMAMVKAFAYGSGSEEVASLLQYHGIDYLGVAYPDEGTELRKNNIRLPIMVMNPTEESFAAMITHDLEPEIYSISLLKAFAVFLNGRPWKIHIKLDTGMHRLGFEESEMPLLLECLTTWPNLKVASVFSHLAGADDPDHDEFTHVQANRFTAMAAMLQKNIQDAPIFHLLNSSGILRFPEYQLGMVRLGIGLYGINPTTDDRNQLIPAATLKTIVSQLKTIQQGDSIGYGRKGKALRKMTIATIAIGYADGFSRAFSQGVGEVLVHGKAAPVVGNVCMDMTMIDVTDIPVREGDEVIIFGKELPIGVLAGKIKTIPYEILTSTSERVKRVFYAESI